jgi:hypothetical protein
MEDVQMHVARLEEQIESHEEEVLPPRERLERLLREWQAPVVSLGCARLTLSLRQALYGTTTLLPTVP